MSGASGAQSGTVWPSWRLFHPMFNPLLLHPLQRLEKSLLPSLVQAGVGTRDMWHRLGQQAGVHFEQDFAFLRDRQNQYCLFTLIHTFHVDMMSGPQQPPAEAARANAMRKDANNLGICWHHSTMNPSCYIIKVNLYLFKGFWLRFCYLQPKKFWADVPKNQFKKETEIKRTQILCRIRRL